MAVSAGGIRAGGEELSGESTAFDTGERKCVECRNVALQGRRRCIHCLERSKKKAKRERIRRKEAGLCIACGCSQPPREPSTIYCQNHRRANIERLKRFEQRRKREVFEKYGGVICRCCGETRIEFLALDHIHGGGNRHRREAKIVKLAAWLKRNDYPPGFQVLCFNCNQAKGAGIVCPHQRDESLLDYCI